MVHFAGYQTPQEWLCRALTEFQRDELSRMDQAFRLPMVEITFEDPVVGMALDEQALAVLREGGAVSWIPVDEIPIPKAVRAARPRLVTLTGKSLKWRGAPRFTGVEVADRSIASLLFGKRPRELGIIAGNGSFWELDGAAWIQRSSFEDDAGFVRLVVGNSPDGGQVAFAVRLPKDNRVRILAESALENEDAILCSYAPGRGAVSRAVSSVRADIQEATGCRLVRLQAGNVYGGNLVIGVSAEAGNGEDQPPLPRLLGILGVRPRDLGTGTFKKVDIKPGLEFEMAALARYGQEEVVLAVGPRGGGAGVGWSVARVDERGVFPVAEEALVSAALLRHQTEVPDIANADAFDTFLEGIEATARGRFILNFAGDSIFMIDPSACSKRVVFHPGGGLIRISTRLLAVLPPSIGRGWVSTSSHRVYLIQFDD